MRGKLAFATPGVPLAEDVYMDEVGHGSNSNASRGVTTPADAVRNNTIIA